MAALNEAYRVLRDPSRRATYDAALRVNTGSAAVSVPRAPRPAPAPAAPGAPPTWRESSAPARFPWRFTIGIAVIGAGAVLGGASFLDTGSSPQGPDNVLRPGDCVTIEDNGDAREVSCQQDAEELVVRELVSFTETCQPGMSAHRDRQGMGFACITRRAE
jgi:molecular chaperone DnaJ